MNIICRLLKPRPRFKIGQHIQPSFWKQEWSDRHIVRYIRIEWVDYECYECGDVHVIGWRITYGFQHGELHEDASNRYEWDCAELRHSLTRPA